MSSDAIGDASARLILSVSDVAVGVSISQYPEFVSLSRKLTQPELREADWPLPLALAVSRGCYRAASPFDRTNTVSGIL